MSVLRDAGTTAMSTTDICGYGSPPSRGRLSEASAPCRLLPPRQMHRAGAAGRMRGHLLGIDIVGGCGTQCRLRRHRLFHRAILHGLVLRGDIVQDRRQPALDFCNAHAFPRGVILDLVALDLADAEIEAFGMA